MRRLAAVAAGIATWAAVGAALAVVLALALGSWPNGLALSGVVLTVGSVAWATDPFKSPMAWSEGALMSYQPNAESRTDAVRRRRWQPLRIPAFALAAGILLLGIAAALAAAH